MKRQALSARKAACRAGRAGRRRREMANRRQAAQRGRVQVGLDGGQAGLAEAVAAVGGHGGGVDPFLFLAPEGKMK